MENKILMKAIEALTIAKQRDNEASELAANGEDTLQTWEKAVAAYTFSVELFQKGIQYEQVPSSKEQYARTMLECLNRAEEIKKALKDFPDKAASPKGSGGVGQAHAKPADKKDDGDKAKLEGQLASAIVREKPNVKWGDVAGLELAKESLKEAVILPARFPQLFVGKRKPWKGILLYGPPGTGKSFLAKAVATETDGQFLSVTASDLMSKWVGEGEKLVKTLFAMAHELAPSVIFVDEIDSVATARTEGENDATRRVKTEFMTCMDGVGKDSGGVLVLAATNVPWELDLAIRRRFQKRIYIALPEAPARASIFALNLGDTPHCLSAEDFAELGSLTDMYSGSDIANVTQEALWFSVRKCQQAKQFMVDGEGMCTPCDEYPSCPQVNLTKTTTIDDRSLHDNPTQTRP